MAVLPASSSADTIRDVSGGCSLQIPQSASDLDGHNTASMTLTRVNPGLECIKDANQRIRRLLNINGILTRERQHGWREEDCSNYRVSTTLIFVYLLIFDWPVGALLGASAMRSLESFTHEVRRQRLWGNAPVH